jgi:hypothetical protein
MNYVPFILSLSPCHWDAFPFARHAPKPIKFAQFKVFIMFPKDVHKPALEPIAFRPNLI